MLSIITSFCSAADLRKFLLVLGVGYDHAVQWHRREFLLVLGVKHGQEVQSRLRKLRRHLSSRAVTCAKVSNSGQPLFKRTAIQQISTFSCIRSSPELVPADRQSPAPQHPPMENRVLQDHQIPRLVLRRRNPIWLDSDRSNRASIADDGAHSSAVSRPNLPGGRCNRTVSFCVSFQYCQGQRKHLRQAVPAHRLFFARSCRVLLVVLWFVLQGN